MFVYILLCCIHFFPLRWINASVLVHFGVWFSIYIALHRVLLSVVCMWLCWSRARFLLLLNQHFNQKKKTKLYHYQYYCYFYTNILYIHIQYFGFGFKDECIFFCVCQSIEQQHHYNSVVDNTPILNTSYSMKGDAFFFADQHHFFSALLFIITNCP